MARGTGKTTKQMVEAPMGAIFIWCNSHLQYPKSLAKRICREDLKIVGPDFLEDERWAGLELSAVILDHAAHELLTDRRLTLWRALQTRIRSR